MSLLTLRKSSREHRVDSERLRSRSIGSFGLAVGIGLTVFGFVGSVSAHVAFTNPALDAELTPGATVTLSWVDVIAHDTEFYDLDFIQSPGAAPQIVAHDLPVGTRHYDWQVPNVECATCSLLVVQRNQLASNYQHLRPISIGVPRSDGSGGAAAAGAANVQMAGATATATSAGGSNSAGAAQAPGSGPEGISCAVSRGRAAPSGLSSLTLVLGLLVYRLRRRGARVVARPGRGTASGHEPCPKPLPNPSPRPTCFVTSEGLTASPLTGRRGRSNETRADA